MRLSQAICIVALLGGGAQAAAEPVPTVAPAAPYSVTLLDDKYHFPITIDPTRDPNTCEEPGEPLTSNQAPSNYEFTFYQCSGPAFRRHMSGPNGLVAQAIRSGKHWGQYATVVGSGGAPVGYIFATCIDVPERRCTVQGRFGKE